MINLALAGIGEVALEHHVPAINSSSNWRLAATFSRKGFISGVDAYHDFSALLRSRDDIEAVSLCQPPKPRLQYAIAALQNNRHVMLEKPTGATISECLLLKRMAQQNNLCLFATWHSRKAHMVENARNWLADKKLKCLHIDWREDVRRWHDGQEWIWQPGGFGVFDPGINALSIVTYILPDPIYVTSARLEVPENRSTPIAAALTFGHPHNASATASFDWREQGEQSWSIEADTDAGLLVLNNGGSELFINGEKIDTAAKADTISSDAAMNTLGNEYRRLYERFYHLIQHKEIDMDLAPLQLVADAVLLGSRKTVEAFHY